ncbi:MAG TPA: DUF438 domain-containing protein [Acholeplasmataceae bacterium]|nr:DUF438 domain-containing protein [Acholeplasmataceae bacterium]
MTNNITTKEIYSLEQTLVLEGSVTIKEIQKLCDVHAAIFEGSISDIHGLSDYTKSEGHPIEIFLNENRRIERLMKEEIKPYLFNASKQAHLMLRIGLDRLAEIDKHYKRKENLFFPGLERKGITTPPQVMWGVDDEIRADLKAVIKLVNSRDYEVNSASEKIVAVIERVEDMIFKEDNILLPLLIENLSHFDWILVDSAQDEIGYFLETPKVRWTKKEEQLEKPAIKAGEIPFDAGVLSFLEANQILNTIPFDMTFVDKDGYVKYFTQGPERLFERPKTVLKRHVTMCHPPESVATVKKIVSSFESGEKDKEEFWIQLRDKFILISYFAIRDPENNYLGTLEVTQNIKPLRELEGEKRILRDKD